jgi:aldose 1-epimerase
MTQSQPFSGPPSRTGQQWVIGHGRQHVVVTEVGATLRSYSFGGEPVVDGFGEDDWSHDGRGQVLAPWPNRLGNGIYEFGEHKAQAALDEPTRFNAIHGLVRWLPWSVEAFAQNVVVLRCDLRPSPGYPFCLGLRIEYRLGREGLAVMTTATNQDEGEIPFGLGFHPYLTAGTERIDTSTLRLPVTRRLKLDDRALPTGEGDSILGTDLDFTAGRAIGPTQMDHAFTSLLRGDDGRAWATLVDPRGQRGVELWVDEKFDYLMCYSCDTLSDQGARRRSIAIEPMTCPPDALRSGKDLIVLDPGMWWQGSWGLRPI